MKTRHARQIRKGITAARELNKFNREMPTILIGPLALEACHVYLGRQVAKAIVRNRVAMDAAMRRLNARVEDAYGRRDKYRAATHPSTDPAYFGDDE